MRDRDGLDSETRHGESYFTRETGQVREHVREKRLCVVMETRACLIEKSETSRACEIP